MHIKHFIIILGWSYILWLLLLLHCELTKCNLNSNRYRTHTAYHFNMFRVVSRVHSRMKTPVKLTLVTGAIIVTSVLIMKAIMAMQLATAMNFQVDTNNGLLMNMSDHYLNRRYFQIRSDDIIYDVSSSSSSQYGRRKRSKVLETRRLPLLIREHKKEDVVRCFDSLSVKRNQRPITIAFIGDSTARQQYISLIRSVPDYDRQLQSRYSIEYVEKFYHDDLNLTSHLLNDLKLSFYWRNFINEEMFTLFRRWASTDDDTQAPDIIFIGATVHHVVAYNNITLKMYEKLLENELAPLMKQSLAAHSHQEIIWMKPSLTIEHHTNGPDSSLHQDKMKKYTDILPRIFKDTRVVIWDTINVIAEEYVRACTLTRYNRHDVRNYQHCNDMIHTGMGAIALGNRLFLNHICESVFHPAPAADLRF